MTANRRERIRAFNDELRHAPYKGKVVLTRGIACKGLAFVSKAMSAVATFESFDEGNDPYLEHDFGAVEIEGESVFWKIDYYDLTLTTGASDPADPTTCVRVLTVMMADEY